MMAIDPVWETVLDQGNRQIVAGEEYVFCSAECLQRFDAEQDLFTTAR